MTIWKERKLSCPVNEVEGTSVDMDKRMITLPPGKYLVNGVPHLSNGEPVSIDELFERTAGLLIQKVD